MTGASRYRRRIYYRVINKANFKEDKTDIVLGGRNYIPRLSERFIDFITSLRIPLHDTGTGFRSI